MLQTRLSFPQSIVRHRANCCPVILSKRWFDWDPSVTRKDGKPAITGSKATYVARDIPVVLLRDVKDLGPKGAIVDVRRGYARHVLIPNKDAVYGTVWENIDAFADPEVVRKSKMEETVREAQTKPPFDWINEVRIELVREVDRTTGKLLEPVYAKDVLALVSEQEHLDLLPSQLSMPSEVIDSVGRHDVHVSLPLTAGHFTYSFKVDIKDKEEVASAERREAELREAMKMKRPDFVLGSHKQSSDNTEDGVEDSDSDIDHSSDSE
jgi:large subunit ribosomal protein L9